MGVKRKGALPERQTSDFFSKVNEKERFNAKPKADDGG